MKILTLFFVIAILAVTILGVLATSAIAEQNPPILSWSPFTPTSSSSKITTMKKIRLHLPLRNEHLLDLPERKGHAHTERKGHAHTTEELKQLAELHEQADCLLPDEYRNVNKKNGDDEIGLRLALWRRIIAPSCEHEIKSKKSLADAGLDKLCTRASFDHYECDEVDAALVEKVFGVELEHVKETRIGVMTRLSAKKDPTKSLDGFAFASNLRVGTDDMQARRFGKVKSTRAEEEKLEEDIRLRQELKEKRRKMKQASKSSSSDSRRSAKTLAKQRSSWPLQVNGNLPDILSTQFQTPYVLPEQRSEYSQVDRIQSSIYCKDGNFPDSDFSCNKDGDTPTLVDIAIYTSSDSNLPICTFSSIGDPSTFLSLSESCTAYSGGATLCDFFGPNFNSVSQTPDGCGTQLPMWQPLVIAIRTHFKDGTSTDWSNSKVWSWGRFTGNDFSSIQSNLPESEAPINYDIDGRLPQFDQNKITSLPTPAAGLFPQDIRKMYNFPNYSKNDGYPVNPKSSIGIFEAAAPEIGNSQSHYKKSDLKLYMQNTNTPFNENLINYIGLDPEDSVAGESQLDIELIASLTKNVPIYFWAYDATGFTTIAGIFESWANQLVNDLQSFSVRPTVWSVSYGTADSSLLLMGEALAAVQRTGTKIQMLASAGITVVVSSGDTGSSGSKAGYVLSACFPSTSPQAIAVGATTPRYSTRTGKFFHQPTNAIYGDLITSTGGASGTFPAPSYQQNLTGTTLDPLSRYRNTKRLTPDVSALGSSIYVVNDGTETSVSGTSASAPIVASILVNLNNQRMMMQQQEQSSSSSSSSSTSSSMTNTAAWIYDKYNTADRSSTTNYSQFSLFRDVPKEAGDNCAGETQGGANIPMNIECFTTQDGWDAVTGWGEPVDFNNLLDSFVSFSPPPVQIVQYYHAAPSSVPWAAIGGGLGGAAALAILVGVICYQCRNVRKSDRSNQDFSYQRHGSMVIQNSALGQQSTNYRTEASV